MKKVLFEIATKTLLAIRFLVLVAAFAPFWFFAKKISPIYREVEIFGCEITFGFLCPGIPVVYACKIQ